MTGSALLPTALAAMAVLATLMPTEAAPAEGVPCLDCMRVRVGPPVVVRGPFPDELDAPFSALQLPDGSFRGFSANGSTYAIDGSTLWDMGGPRREVLQAGEPGSANECGRWLTSLTRSGDKLLGLVHQERICDYGPGGQTDKTMAIASSADNGLTWTDLGNIITGRDSPRRGTISGEGDCTMVDGHDGYLYAYCLRNSDWQTIVARAAASAPTAWYKYQDGDWSEPGLGGEATAIGFLGPSAGYLQEFDAVAILTADPWFGGVRLSLSRDKVTFADLDEPLLSIDGSDWERPAATDLIAYESILDPDSGSNNVGGRFLLSYIYVPPGKGFESRYLVHHEVTLAMEDAPLVVQTGMALSRWVAPDRDLYVTSTGPMTGDRLDYRHDAVLAHMLTHAPEGIESVKLEECASNWPGHLDQVLAVDGRCGAEGYTRERTAGWLYADEQPGTVPVYRCYNGQAVTHFASTAPDCEALGEPEFLLGYGLAP